MRLRRGIPVAAMIAMLATAARAEAAVPHIVQEGESLWSIAAAQNMTTRTVAVYNSLAEDAVVVAGETIQIPTVAEGASALQAAGVGTDPGPATAPTGTPAGAAGSHTVAPGETLSGIAAVNGISVAALAAANGRAADSLVHAGETLQIPAAGPGSQPAGSGTAGLGHVSSPYGELHLVPAAADDWNAMREESLRVYGQDLYPGGPLSAYRTYDQQAQLYRDYLAGTGPLAAAPGTSAHELGTAVDVETPEMRWTIDQIGWSYGWGKTEAPSEWWHVNHAP